MTFISKPSAVLVALMASGAWSTAAHAQSAVDFSCPDGTSAYSGNLTAPLGTSVIKNITPLNGAGFSFTSTKPPASGLNTGPDGDRVILVNCAPIQTSGSLEFGIVLSTIGGTGSNGSNYTITPEDGGLGRPGGDGGILSVYTSPTATILTSGDHAHGIFVFGLGGVGGNGGTSVCCRGGYGGVGGNGGVIEVSNQAQISVSGYAANGIFARSQGGIAGNGRGGGIFGGSGDGGAGGNGGGDVDVNNSGAINVSGADSSAIRWESVGGHAGNSAKDHGAFVSLGGDGGNGGNAGAVTGTNTGSLITTADNSKGISAQSIGGGGGNGGDAYNIGVFGGVAVGGSGGGGGFGGIVEVLNSGSIRTSGITSPGILAHSVGGGGGDGGSANGVTVGVGLAFQTSIGGSGGSGGDGGQVEVNQDLTVSLTGASTSSSIVTGFALGDTPAVGTGGSPGDISAGVLAQSVGGGGGVGGRALSVAASTSETPTVSIAVGIGGSGGSGGKGATVSTSLAQNGTTSIITTGRLSDGVLTQSIGGGGGNGGNVITVAAAVAETAGAISAAIGGTAGSGGDGGRTEVYSAATVSTFSTISSGLVSRSVGGGGGSGGNVTDIAATLGKYSGTIGLGVGGTGGNGGNGGTAVLLNSGNVSTLDHLSQGLVAQSIGGGGGSGGNVHTYAISASILGGSNGLAAAASVGIGGHGGIGGAGGIVSASNDGSITTYGDLSQGVLVQSIGGGGGAGGNVIALSVAASLNAPTTGGKAQGGRNLSAAVAVGGVGGRGGVGGNVTFSTGNNSNITTNGVYSAGIFAQSVGGGGGSGGHAHSFALASSVPVDLKPYYDALNSKANLLLTAIGKGDQTKNTDADTKNGLAATVSVGGNGGSGNLGGEVDLTLAPGSSITTTNSHSVGIFAQSIGGGGGAGGYAFSDGFAGADAFGITMGIGGNGGTGGNGGNVNLGMANFGDGGGGIVTQGDMSHGILAQSIGAGGGEAGHATSQFFTIPGLDALTNVENSFATIIPNTLLGLLSKFSLSLSIGGTGGASGNGAAVNVDYGQSISTLGAHASAIIAQSVGGGGGIGGGSAASGLVNFDLGGSGGAAGNGGAVMVSGSSDLLTRGVNAHGLIAQSVGGGGYGGNAGKAASATDHGLLVHIGGGGGGGGNGGAVTVSRSGTITTTGATAFGILAQSVGGGGGLVSASNLTVGIGAIPLTVNYSGNLGSGGDVVVNSAGQTLDISTLGNGAHGVFAQSVGGGGGIVVATGVAGFTGDPYSPPPPTLDNDSTGGDVTTAINGAISTSGDNAHGIFAQSLSSGTMLVTDSGTYQAGVYTALGTGVISIAQAGSVSTQGSGSHGIVAINSNGGQSLDLNQPPAIDINIAGSVNVSGSGAWGVEMTNGYASAPAPSPNLLGSHVTIAAGASVNATGAAAGGINSMDYLAQTIVRVNGTLNAGTGVAVQSVGQMDLSVAAGGLVVGDILGGGGGLFENEGTIYGSIISGADYFLDPGGQHFLAVDPTGNAGGTDVIQVWNLNLDGGVIRPYLTSLPTGAYSKSQFVSNGSEFFFGNLVLTNTLSTVFDYQRNGNSFDLTNVTVDFGRAGLTGNDGNLAQLATSLLGSWTAEIGNTTNAPLNTLLLGLANATDPAVLSKGLEDFDTATDFSTGGIVALTQGNDLSNMQSCGTASGSFAAIKESECNWAKVGHSDIELRDGDQKHSATSLSLGRQMEISPDVFLGLSAGYENSDYDGITTTGKGDRYYVGAIAKLSRGPILASAAAGLSYGHFNGKRLVAATGDVARSKHKARALATRLRAGYLFEAGAVHVTPLVELDMSLIKDAGYRETGAGPFDLMVHPKTYFVADLRPALRLATDVNVGGAVVRGYAEGGAKIALNELSHKVSLPDAPQVHDPVSLAMGRDRVLGTLATGLSIHAGERIEINGRYEAGFGKDTRIHSASLKIGYRF